jgi:hypothetical protein
MEINWEKIRKDFEETEGEDFSHDEKMRAIKKQLDLIASHFCELGAIAHTCTVALDKSVFMDFAKWNWGFEYMDNITILEVPGRRRTYKAFAWRDITVEEADDEKIV